MTVMQLRWWRCGSCATASHQRLSNVHRGGGAGGGGVLCILNTNYAAANQMFCGPPLQPHTSNGMLIHALNRFPLSTTTGKHLSRTPQQRLSQIYKVQWVEVTGVGYPEED